MMRLSHKSDTSAVIVAADGSARKEVICSAWLSDSGGWFLHSRPANLYGRNNPHAALHAELYALAAAEKNHPHQVVLLTDCQAAEWYIKQWQSGNNTQIPNYLGRSLLIFSDRVRQRGETLHVEWVKGHSMHPLNEGADALASLGCRADRDGITKAEVRDRANGLAIAFTEAQKLV
jgi:ribonuclease HI